MKLKYFTAILMIGIIFPMNARAFDGYVSSGGSNPNGRLYYNVSTYSGASITCPVFGWTGYESYMPAGNISIPDSITHNGTTYPVTLIGSDAFYRSNGMDGLVSVTIPNTVTSIGLDAFYNCINLVSVNIPTSVTTINGNAFRNCHHLYSLNIPTSVTNIGTDAFYNGVTHIFYNGTATGGPWGAPFLNGYVENNYVYSDSTKTTLTGYVGNSPIMIVPNTVDSIAEYALRGCSTITSVTISQGVRSIGKNAFWRCPSITSVNFNADSCYFMGGNYPAFIGCSTLTSLNIGNNVKMIPSDAFYRTGITSLNVPASVKHIGTYAFGECTQMTTAILPTGLKAIDPYVFYMCSSLSTVIMPSDLDTIGLGAFYNCTALVNATIPSSVKRIGAKAFRGCSSLTSAVLPPALRDIENTVFSRCTSLASVTIPSTVRTIGDFAFYMCTSLSSVTLPASLQSIDTSAFDSCLTLSSIIIPDSVSFIGDSVFRYCSSLSTATIGASVTHMGSDVFTGCNALDSVNMMSVVPPALSPFTFRYIRSNLPILVPCGATANYQSATYWNAFTNIRENGSCYLTLTGTSATPSLGEVLGSGRYNNGSQVPLYAIAYAGNKFVGWTDGNTNNPRTVTVVSDTTFTATFALSDTVYVHDTTIVYDTLWLHDTVTFHDTIYLHDTIYVNPEGINGANAVDVKLYQRDGQIVVEGSEGAQVTLYDAVGRLLATKQDNQTTLYFDVPVTGAYLVRVGNYPARRIVVVK